MRERISGYKWMLLITSAIILSPMLVGLYFWDQLPEQIATHWGIHGEPNGWSSRGFAVFGIPLFLLAMQVLCFALDKYNVHMNQNKKVMRLILWIIPVVSIFVGVSIYGYALGHDVHIETVAPILTSVLFIVVGNYLPKCTLNRTVGIKLPWTFESEANWNATHRFAGRVWVAAGVLTLGCALLPAAVFAPVVVAILIMAALLPVFYSYWYHRRKG